MQQYKTRIVGHADIDPQTLIDHPLNWRAHPDNQRASLEGSLSELGWIQEVIVNQPSGMILDGHLRVALARRSNQHTVPVTLVDLTEEEERKALIAIDPIAAQAGVHHGILEALLKQTVFTQPGLTRLQEDLAAANKIVLGSVEALAEVAPPSEPEGTYKEQYGVIVICDSAEEQETIYNDLAEQGYEHLKVVST